MQAFIAKLFGDLVMLVLQKDKSQPLLNLVKRATDLDTVVVGSGWDASNGRSIDLDTSIICFDKNKKKTDKYVYFGQKTCGNFLKHTGDDLTGESSDGGDDEQIILHLSKVPAEIEYIAVTLNSFSGHRFNKINNAYARVFIPEATNFMFGLNKKLKSKQELLRVELDGLANSNHTGAVLAIFYRSGTSWLVKSVIGTSEQARNFSSMWSVAASLI
jgi:tellurium resistance protein TerZ